MAATDVPGYDSSGDYGGAPFTGQPSYDSGGSGSAGSGSSFDFGDLGGFFTGIGNFSKGVANIISAAEGNNTALTSTGTTLPLAPTQSTSPWTILLVLVIVIAIIAGLFFAFKNRK